MISRHHFSALILFTILILVSLYLTTTLLPPTHLQAYETFLGKTGLLQHDQNLVQDGYVIFSSFNRVYLLDTQGRIINEWDDLSRKPKLLKNGNIIGKPMIDPKDDNSRSKLVELNWEGEQVWEYSDPRDDYFVHHDYERIFNAKLGKETLLYIANKDVSHDQAIAAGANPANGPYEEVQVDAVVEVDLEGNILWEWWFFDHLIQDHDPSKDNYVESGKTIADYPGKINVNLPGKPLRRDWLHVNSIDYNPDLGHIVLNSVHGEFYVIDHDGTFIPNNLEESLALAASDKGDFLYRFGDPARYEQGNPPQLLDDWTLASTGHKQIGGSHDVSWIEPGREGEGNLLVFNNGQMLFQRTMYSSILEINPFIQANGQPNNEYVNPPESGYEIDSVGRGGRSEADRFTSKQVVWRFRPQNAQSFFGPIGSGTKRLANNNTFVCNNPESHMFEVTREGQVVWEYVNPKVEKDLAVQQLDENQLNSNAISCGTKYSADHPGLVGKDLTPGPTLLEKYGNNDEDSGEDSNLSRLNPSQLSTKSIIILGMTLSGTGLAIGFWLGKKQS